MLSALLVVFSLRAETLWFKAFSYSYHETNSYGYWKEWSPWYSCDVNIKFDLSDDAIIIYSKRTQIYVITEYAGEGTDSDGGKQIAYRVIDQDYDRGTIRLRIERNGNSQLYVDFADVGWVYNVRRWR